VKPEAAQANEDLRDYYRDSLGSTANKNEAWSLGVSESLVSLFLKPGSDKNLDFGLATRSMARDQLAAYFAQKCGGVFVKLAGEMDGDSSQELRAALQAIAELQVERDPRKRKQLILTAAKNLAKAGEEESK
jgi:hypothetical protein